MNPSSLRLRLLLAWAVFIILTLQIAGLGLRLLFERSITRRTQTELLADLRQLKRGMEVAPGGTITIVREPTDPQFDIVLGGRYWQVADGANILVRSRSLDQQSLAAPEPPADPMQRLWILGPNDQKLIAVVQEHLVPGPANGTVRRLHITTAVDASEIREDTGKFTNDLYWGLAGLAAAPACRRMDPRHRWSQSAQAIEVERRGGAARHGKEGRRRFPGRSHAARTRDQRTSRPSSRRPQIGA